MTRRFPGQMDQIILPVIAKYFLAGTQGRIRPSGMKIRAAISAGGRNRKGQAIDPDYADSPGFAGNH